MAGTSSRSIFNNPPLSIYRISGLSPANLSEHELHCMAYSCWLVEWRDIDWEARCRTIIVDCKYRENRNYEAWKRALLSDINPDRLVMPPIWNIPMVINQKLWHSPAGLLPCSISHRWCLPFGDDRIAQGSHYIGLLIRGIGCWTNRPDQSSSERGQMSGWDVWAPGREIQ